MPVLLASMLHLLALRARSLHSLALRACLLLIVASLTGCGTGGYYERMQDSLETLPLRVGASRLHQQPVVDGVTGISLRLPRWFGSKSISWSDQAMTFAGEAPPPQLLHPPLESLSNFRFNYRTVVESGQQRAVATCFVAYGKMSRSVSDNARLGLLGQLRSSLQLPKLAWEETSIQPLPEDEAARLPEPQSWHRLELAAEMDFAQELQGGRVAKMPGLLRIYARHADGRHILIGWHFPAAAAAEESFDQTLRACVASLEFAEPDPQARRTPFYPDITLQRDPINVPGTQIMLTPPSIFDERTTSFHPNAARSRGGEIADGRIVPIEGTFPGHRFTYERIIGFSESGKSAVYLYVALIEGPLEKEAFARAGLTDPKRWPATRVKAPDGTVSRWQRVRREVPVETASPAAPGKLRTERCYVHAYLKTSRERHLLIAFRAPTWFGKHATDFFTTAAESVGSVTGFE